jgi:hypothetical protein
MNGNGHLTEHNPKLYINLLGIQKFDDRCVDGGQDLLTVIEEPFGETETLTVADKVTPGGSFTLTFNRLVSGTLNHSLDVASAAAKSLQRKRARIRRSPSVFVETLRPVIERRKSLG